MFTFDATEQINEVSRTRTTRTTTQVITRYFDRWPQTKTEGLSGVQTRTARRRQPQPQPFLDYFRGHFLTIVAEKALLA